MAGAEQIQLQQFEVASIAAPPALLCQQLQLSSKGQDCETDKLVLRNPALLLRVLDAQFRIKARRQTEPLSQRLRALDSEWLHSLLSDMSLQLILQGSKQNQLFSQLHWQQARRSALFARELALQVTFQDVQAAEMCGLLMHAGMLVLEQQHRAAWVGLFLETGSQSRLLEAEQQTLNIDHIEAGVRLLESWWLEQNCIDAVRYQAMPLDAVLDATPLVRICWLANRMAAMKPDPALEHAAEQLLQLPLTALAALQGRVKQEIEQEFSSRGSAINTLITLPLEDQVMLHFEQQSREELQKLQLQMLGESALTALEGLDTSTGENLKSVLARALQQAEVDPRFMILATEAGSKRLAILTSNRVANLPSDLALQLLPGRSALANIVLATELATLTHQMAGLTVIDKQVIDLLGGGSLLCESVKTTSGYAVLLLAGSANYPQRKLLRAFVKRKLAAVLQQSNSLTADPQFDLLLYQQRVREAIHEANNPLAIIKNYLQIHSIKQGDAAGSKEIRLIHAEIDRVAAILAELRQTEVLPTLSGELDINALLRSMHKVFVQAFNAEKQIKIELDLTDDPALILGCSDALKQILTNLVKNAAEAFTQDGSIVLTTKRNVYLQDKQHKMYLQLSVADNGPGMAAVMLQSMFVSGSSTKGGDHAGSGLSIVKRLVDEMQGQISCQSDNKGTVISILLPQIN